jgi:hypothetical protein
LGALGSLEDRLLGEEGFWADLYRIEGGVRDEREVNLLDPLDYLSALPEFGSLSKLDEYIRAQSNQVLDGAREYLAITVLATEFCLARALNPWRREPRKPTLKMSIASTALFGINAELPADDPTRVGPQALKAVSLWGAERVCGLNLSNPVSFVERYVRLLTPTPSALLAKVVNRNLKPQVDPELYSELKEVLAEAWAKVSEAEMGVDDFDFAHTPEGEPALLLSDIKQPLPWNYTSSGIVNLIGHWLALSVLSPLRYWRRGRAILVSVEEPETHLDPYAAYLLPRLYAKAAEKLGATFVVATHSEAFVKGVEDAVGEGLLKAESVKVYETVGSEKLFKLRELTVREDGTIEGSRFTRIAKLLLLQKKLKPEGGSA